MLECCGDEVSVANEWNGSQRSHGHQKYVCDRGSSDRKLSRGTKVQSMWELMCCRISGMQF